MSTGPTEDLQEQSSKVPEDGQTVLLTGDKEIDTFLRKVGIKKDPLSAEELFHKYVSGDLDGEGVRAQVCDALEHDPNGKFATMVRDHEERMKHAMDIDWEELAISIDESKYGVNAQTDPLK